jgi:tRNA dimethylallyltransferase
VVDLERPDQPADVARVDARRRGRIDRAEPAVQRAGLAPLEVYHHTGRPISALQRAGEAVGPTVRIGLTMDRAALYRAIDARVDTQIRAGLVEEVRALLDRGVDPARPAMQGLGYKEIVQHLVGEVPLEEAVRRLKRNTRRFAKRQYTWFRADLRIHWIDVGGLDAPAVARRIEAVLSSGRAR